jgi:serine protease AprX
MPSQSDPLPHLSERICYTLRPTLVTPPLLSWLGDPDGSARHLIIELNTEFPRGLLAARALVEGFVYTVSPTALARNLPPGAMHPYVFAELKPAELLRVLEQDSAATQIMQVQTRQMPLNREPVVNWFVRAIRKVWESDPIRPLTTVSIRTVKADAAHAAFTALGQEITWAVMDSGIEASHPHFQPYRTLDVVAPLEHRSFLPSRPDGTPYDPTRDEFGHGTHVAGIIAGASAPGSDPRVARLSVDSRGTNPEFHLHRLGAISGMAPQCKLLSVRILDDSGNGDAISVISALEWLIQLNGDGTKPLVHGVNLSAGYLPDPEVYGSGQSPICRQVNRAVRSGLVVVVAAGNYGYSLINAVQQGGALRQWDAGAFASIADPANADLAIAVGSTHREEPHRYGISYFSSKGPTSDGRRKPDIVAPGERIISCAAGTARQRVEVVLQQQRMSAASASGALRAAAPVQALASVAPAVTAPAGAPPGPASNSTVSAGSQFDYLEDSGTSMAAPHTSGVIAAFLSVRREFIGEPQKVAALVCEGAVDLKRDPNLQGAGLIDLFRMLQSV